MERTSYLLGSTKVATAGRGVPTSFVSHDPFGELLRGPPDTQLCYSGMYQ